jgi:hypothetical protein
MSNPIGRPSDYDAIHVTEMLKFFLEWPLTRTVKKQIVSNGRVINFEEVLVNYPPTLNKYSIKIGTDRHTLKRWADENGEFRTTYMRCKAIQEEWLSDRGTTGEYNPGFTKLMLVNHTDIKDKVTHEVDDDTKKALKLAYAITN